MITQTHIVSPETIETLRGRKNGSLVKLARELGFEASFAGALSDILRQRVGHVSLLTENRVRAALGIEPIASYEVPPCPDCGGVPPIGRCHNKPVGSVIVRPPRPQSPAWLIQAAEWLRQREGSGPPVLRSYTRQGKPY